MRGCGDLIGGKHLFFLFSCIRKLFAGKRGGNSRKESTKFESLSETESDQCAVRSSGVDFAGVPSRTMSSGDANAALGWLQRRCNNKGPASGTAVASGGGGGGCGTEGLSGSQLVQLQQPMTVPDSERIAKTVPKFGLPTSQPPEGSAASRGGVFLADAAASRDGSSEGFENKRGGKVDPLFKPTMFKFRPAKDGGDHFTVGRDASAGPEKAAVTTTPTPFLRHQEQVQQRPKFGLPGMVAGPPPKRPATCSDNAAARNDGDDEDVMFRPKINSKRQFEPPPATIKRAAWEDPGLCRQGGTDHRQQQQQDQEQRGQQAPNCGFRTAKEQLLAEQRRKFGKSDSGEKPYPAYSRSGSGQQPQMRTLGVASAARRPFRPPVPDDGGGGGRSDRAGQQEEEDERLRGIDPKMVELIRNEIMEDHGARPVDWSDIAGLEFVKTTVKEAAVFPLLRPDIFAGLRAPPRGILLFGPPGTGKTLIGKCIASQSGSTFFAISASSLTSKWVGEGEKMVRALFAVARVHQPSVVFIDEVDSLLSARSDSEHESSRRIKTEFLVQLDGASTVGEERILVVGATNRPKDLDEAARRRLVKRLYVPLPELEAREQIVRQLLSTQLHELTDEEVSSVARRTEGYSGADMANLCKESAMGPVRCLDYSRIDQIRLDEVRPISLADFDSALRVVKASVSDQDLDAYAEWNARFGCGK